ncbi:uncharacterized protein LOC141620851 [Silene latifolia]|uniref:uncharacterized protein LOC141620851 n=1 Tax=Silene latifolia TaxID=37657 RepID=UPI003D76C9DC
MGKALTITQLFKRKIGEISRNETNEQTTTMPTNMSDESQETTPLENRPAKVPRSMEPSTNSYQIVRDPGKRKQIWEYPPEKRNEIRRAYISNGPYQPVFKPKEYPKSGSDTHGRRFQASWYHKFPSWLEYSPDKDAAFCFVCFLFNKPDRHRAFTIDGFQNWKHASGKKGSFIKHLGGEPNSHHQNAEKELEDFLNQGQHIPNVYAKQTPREIANNRLRLANSINALRWLAVQGLAMRGRDESESSSNRGNFLELLKYQASFSTNVVSNRSKNATYTSPDIQIEILQILAEKVKRAIKEEIGGAPFCIIVDEAGDVSGKQQMALILRFVDNLGLVQERFFGIIHVPNTSAMTLKKEIFEVLSHYSFDMKNLRGQGYDGASNMRGKWNGLQAVVIRECPYAYFVHCFAHRLQLALVAAAKEVIPVCQFFSKLSFVINVVLASYKRVDALRNAYSREIEMLIEDGELETGVGLNQMSNLQRPGDTRWSSHLRSISSLIKLFSSSCSVLYMIIDEGETSAERAQATTTLDTMTSFEFIFILHLMKKILEVSDVLSQALQRKSQDILNSLHLVESTKVLLQKLRDDGWESLLAEVVSFCERRNIELPDMNSIYIERGGRARRQHDEITIANHYRRNVFCVAIDKQLHELNYRFNEKSVELLTLSCALEPRASRHVFKIDDICHLVHQFYPEDFTDVEKEELRVQLCHYEVDLSRQQDLENLSTISDLSQWLVSTGKLNIYPLIFQLTKLLLTLPVSTASAERAFSSMNIVKNTRRNKMEADFFESCMIIYIEREIAKTFSTDSIIDTFRDLKERKVLL